MELYLIILFVFAHLAIISSFVLLLAYNSKRREYVQVKRICDNQNKTISFLANEVVKLTPVRDSKGRFAKRLKK